MLQCFLRRLLLWFYSAATLQQSSFTLIPLQIVFFDALRLIRAVHSILDTVLKNWDSTDLKSELDAKGEWLMIFERFSIPCIVCDFFTVLVASRDNREQTCFFEFTVLVIDETYQIVEHFGCVRIFFFVSWI